jgi:hypothetical protein
MGVGHLFGPGARMAELADYIRGAVAERRRVHG